MSLETPGKVGRAAEPKVGTPVRPVLEIERLSVDYATEAGPLHAVRDVSFTVSQRESVGLVGESGSGKSTLVMGAIGYLGSNGHVRDGSVRLNGTELVGLPAKQLRRLWGSQIGVVSQNPLGALNPSIVIGKQLAEGAQLHLGLDRRQSLAHAEAMLVKVSMPDPESIMRRYPHQLSGGMLQRCCIAMALTTSPSLLILDEPTTALDVTTQAVVLDLIEGLKREFDSAIVYITHDLGVVTRICDQVCVMYAGESLEQAPLRDLFREPLHPYTRALLGCVPQLRQLRRKSHLATIPGAIARFYRTPECCVFVPRCSFATVECGTAHPPLREIRPGHATSCLRWNDLPPREERLLPAEHLKQEWAEDRETETMLEADDIHVHFESRRKSPFARQAKEWVRAVQGVSLRVGERQTLGVVGESGSGKTTLARALAGLVGPTSGTVKLRGEELAPIVARRTPDQLRRIQMVFQNPEASLNPVRTVGDAIGRPLRLFAGLSRSKAKEQALDRLAAVGLPGDYYDHLPMELSGGEQQRVAIARAFAGSPDLVFCDEPISSLDVSIQGALMNLLMDLQCEEDVSYVFISHDLSAVQHLSHWIAVMYVGALVEYGPTERVLAPPYHPYTEALLSAVPIADPDVQQRRIRLQGSVPSAVGGWEGCIFHTRCPRLIGDICVRQPPPLRSAADDHWLLCHWEPAELRERQEGLLRTSQGLE